MTAARGQVILDDGRARRITVFSNPSRIIVARNPTEVAPALSAMQDALGSGHYLAGYLSYELGFVFEPRLNGLLPAARTLPLLWFAQFDAPPVELDGADADALWPRARVYATPLTFEWSRATYRTRFASVLELIRAGDIYQANLSMRARFKLTGDPYALYGQLRERANVSYGAFVDDGERQLLSLSPELFFKIDAHRTIVAKPMKGTARRDQDEVADRALCTGLRRSPKERAENIMIVDLLRNDLGRVAETGSVEVPELFAVEAYPTVYQMTSTVRAKIRPTCGITHVLRALFPCGSVTGTPKVRAMQVIRDTEGSPRGAYCGAIGAFTPDGCARFNVAIRTITIAGGWGELGVGSAVVADSCADAEYDECLLKARYFEDTRRPIKLLETMAYTGNAWARRSSHLRRMGDSARALGIPFNLATATTVLERAIAPSGASARRVRLSLDEDGTPEATASALPPRAERLQFVIAARRLDSNDPLNVHKTDWRDAHDDALMWARARGADEAVFLNERGEVAEGTYTNIFLERNGRLLTPPLSSGVLPGCLRAELLASGRCEEATLTMADLLQADRVYLGNSLRGMVPAVLRQTACCK